MGCCCDRLPRQIASTDDSRQLQDQRTCGDGICNEYDDKQVGWVLTVQHGNITRLWVELDGRHTIHKPQLQLCWRRWLQPLDRWRAQVSPSCCLPLCSVLASGY